MSDLQPSDFSAFFRAIYRCDPFPWQRMLVERVAERGWPEGIDLPTASGKTACIDAAVFLLALGEKDGRLPMDHPARRRIFFVVDRRIVVDEAYRRAEALADELQNATEGIVKDVADRLRRLAWGDEEDGLIPASERVPLIASRLRGGTVKDERWRLSPAQPAIITSTVDQLGSRLLFRSYRTRSTHSAPIEAALTGCDSLILLDEAHCAVPFMQTARAVQRYAGSDWTEDDPIVSSLTFSILSATLPDNVKEAFPDRSERAVALDHPLLKRRINASKPAQLIETKDTGDNDEKLIVEVVKQATQAVDNGSHRVAIMVNRVARASKIAAELRQFTDGDKPKLDAELVLMTGRMRPFDRGELVDKWSPYLKAGSERHPDKPIILVTTQCLEVGADFSFDALITECASLDALRQRFGRLNRLGDSDEVDATVMIRKADVKPNNKLNDLKPLDPIYGNAMTRTWNWLNDQATQQRFDFGIAAVDALLPNEHEERNHLIAPSLDAPVMLPAHLDLLCQTAPRPTPDPEVALFLHGPQRYVPEARVVFRADLVDPTADDDWRDRWRDAVLSLPPLTAEALTLPLWLIRKWLASGEQLQPNDLSDVESQQYDEGTSDAMHGQAFVIWRGRRKSTVSSNPQDVRPNETIVVPANEALAENLGQAFCRPDNTPLDIAEQAYPVGREQQVLRLLPAVYRQPGLPEGLGCIEPLKALLAWAKDDEREIGKLDELFGTLQQYTGDYEADVTTWPDWLRTAIADFLNRRPRIEHHPTGGLILLSRSSGGATLDLDFGDIDDSLSMTGQSVSLADHSEHVRKRAGVWARRCLPESFVDHLITAADLHDKGKADPRFQIVLHGDELEAAVSLANDRLLAKSDGLYRSPEEKRRLREAAGLPDDWRHEMLSVQLAEAGLLPDDTSLRELTLHLIGSHHGYGRPFAPVSIDDELPDVHVNGIELPHADRRKFIPPHRLDSGVPERFWQLTRRYGWWGLAYLEAVLRLADRAASAAEAVTASPTKRERSR